MARHNKKVSYMTRLLKLNEINSNLFFVFPIITGYLSRDVIYFSLSASIFIVSFYYHFYKENNNNGLYVKYYRALDIFVATLSYIYMFYFIFMYVPEFKSTLYGLLIATIVAYLFSKRELGKKFNAHTYFHVAIGLVAGVIPLFV
jgi:hypothetical protein